MRPAGGRALLLTVVVAAASAGLWSAHGSASAQTPTAVTITTQLHPGWNLVGWMGPDTTPAALFRDVRLLQIVAAWDEDAGRYVWARRGAAVPPPLERITRGQGLFLWLSGIRAVQWTRPGSAQGMLLALPTGSSVVGWAGLDGTPIAEAVRWFRDALIRASRWNAVTQSYEHYEPGVGELVDWELQVQAAYDSNTMLPERPGERVEVSPVLQHGDALWVELSEERRWWQSGTERTRFVFEGDRSPDYQNEMRGEMDRVEAFFASWYGIEPPEFLVVVPPPLIRTDPTSPIPIRIGFASPGLITTGTGGRHSLAQLYSYILQNHLARNHPSVSGSPVWLTRGTATYAADVYRRERAGRTGTAARTVLWYRSLPVTASLRTLEALAPFEATVGAAFLGALATDWLVARATAMSADVAFDPHAPAGLGVGPEWAAHLDYYRLLRSAFSWRTAFKEAFGIDVDQFYAEFEEYRAKFTAARLPHLADDEDVPLLVFEGEIPADTEARIRAQFEDVQGLFIERLGSGPVDYTMFVAADAASAAAVYLRVSGSDPAEGDCSSWNSYYSLVDLGCQTRLATYLAWGQVARVIDRLAPGMALTAAAGDVHSGRPAWLREAVTKYAEAAARETVGIETLSQTRSRGIAAAEDSGYSLRSMEGSAGSDMHSYDAGPKPPDEIERALTFLAADWLARHAGEPALFEYYRLLPSSDSWEAAFEGAFGITIDDFYAAFADYRAAGFEP